MVFNFSLNTTKVTDTLCEDMCLILFKFFFNYMTLFQLNSRFSVLEFVIPIIEALVLDIIPPEG
jgi:hypothetical protein